MPDRTRDPPYFLHRLADQVPSMLAYWDSELLCRFANRAYEKWFGVDPDALIGTSIRDLLGPELFAQNEPHIRGALAGEPQTFERLVPGPAGTARPALACYLPDVVDGQVRGFIVQVTDVSELKATESELRASEQFLDRTGRLAGVGGWEIDLATWHITWSAHTRRLHEVDDGYQPSVAGSAAFYPASAWTRVERAVERAINDGTPFDFELPFITARRNDRWVRVFGEVDYENGVPTRLVGAFQDITDYRRQQMELLREQDLRQESERHAQALAQLLREREEMLDVLAHEVRQPLNNASAALQGAAATLGGVNEEKASAQLRRAQAVMGQVLASIDNTLAVASLLARPDPIQPGDTDIDTLVAVVVADMPASERGRIVVDRVTRTRTATMDMSLMRLALRNLLSNALRYSDPQRAVTIRVADSDEPLALLIDVEDSGPGLPARVVARLFERGVHSRSDVAQPHGLGLGLYIVRRVMEMHRGRAQLVHNGSNGATFRLSLIQPGDE